jgi:hypothetical protein
VIALRRAELQSQSEVQYILAGSAISVLSGLLSNPSSPLFAQFTRISVGPFDKAKGYRALKSVLQIFSQEEGLTATAVARHL